MELVQRMKISLATSSLSRLQSCVWLFIAETKLLIVMWLWLFVWHWLSNV